MAHNLSRIGRVVLTPQASYEDASKATSTQIINAAGSVECEATAPEPTVELFERVALRGDFHQLPPIVGSPHGATITLRQPLPGLSSTVPTGNVAVGAGPPAAGGVLGAYQWGGPGSGGPETVGFKDSSNGTIAGGTTALIKVKGTTDLNSWGVGSALIVKDTAAGYQMSFIRSKDEDGSNNDLVPIVPLAVAPAEDEAIWGTSTAYLTSTPAVKAVAMVWRSSQTASQLVLQGCVPTSYKIVMDPKARLMIETTFTINRIVADTATELPLSYLYTAPEIPPCYGNNGARLAFLNGSASTAFDVESLELTIDQEYQPQLSHGSATGVGDLVVTNRAVSLSTTVLLGQAHPWDVSAGGVPMLEPTNSATTQSRAIQLTCGSQPGRMFGMLCPSPILSDVSIVDRNGIYAQQLTITPGNHTGDTPADPTDSMDVAANSDFRMAWG